MAFLNSAIFFVSFLCMCYSLETDLITGKTYRLTEDSCTWLEAKSRCSLAGKDVVELDESTGRVRSTANISDSETFTAWIDAYKIQPHVLLNKGCFNLQLDGFKILLNGTNEPRMCAAVCSGVAIHIALQGNRCYCLTAAPVNKVDIDMCNSSCPGDGSKTCGNTNVTTWVSIYEVVHMSEDMCPCVMTKSVNGGVTTYEIIPYIVNCTFIHLYYLCKPQNNKDFTTNDVFKKYENIYIANSSCTFGLAEFYHVEHNFVTKNPQFTLGPSYYINFIRGLTSVVGGVTAPDNPSTCYAYSHDKSYGDSVVERSCTDRLAGLCRYDESTTVPITTTTDSTTTTTDSTTTQHYRNSTDREFTILPIINEENNSYIVVLIIILMVFILSLGFTIKCLCNVLSIMRGRRTDNKHQIISQSSDIKLSQHSKTEQQKGMPVYASVCKKSKSEFQHNNLAYNQENKEFEAYEIENSYNHLITDGKQNTTNNGEGLYDSTADGMYNALSRIPPCTQSVDEDAYDHTISISKVSNLSSKQLEQIGAESNLKEAKQSAGNVSNFTEYMYVTKHEDGLYDHTNDGTNKKQEDGLYDHTHDGTCTKPEDGLYDHTHDGTCTKQEDGLYDHTHDGTYSILSLSHKTSGQVNDNIYDHFDSKNTS